LISQRGPAYSAHARSSAIDINGKIMRCLPNPKFSEIRHAEA
jgi:hypothetical protein